jgi:hypothetical protein
MYSKKSPMKNKGISRDILHQEFYNLLGKIQPNDKLLEVFKRDLMIQVETRKKSKD